MGLVPENKAITPQNPYVKNVKISKPLIFPCFPCENPDFCPPPTPPRHQQIGPKRSHRADVAQRFGGHSVGLRHGHADGHVDLPRTADEDGNGDSNLAGCI